MGSRLKPCLLDGRGGSFKAGGLLDRRSKGKLVWTAESLSSASDSDPPCARCCRCSSSSGDRVTSIDERDFLRTSFSVTSCRRLG